VKTTTDPKTGEKEMQTEEYVPAGPVKIAKPKSQPPIRNPLDVLHERVKNLEIECVSLRASILRIEERLSLPSFTFDAKRAIEIQERHMSQIASLQIAVAALERRIDPLKQ
jgi:hypothetical protein